MRMTLARSALGATIALAALSAVGASPLGCADKKGGLMLAITTDMQAPKDVNVVSVSIQVGPQIKYNFIGRVTPEGEVLLPATLAIVEPENPSETIRVRVIAFKNTQARVLRDIITTSPRGGRVALLRMPLAFVNDGSARGLLPEANLPPRTASFGGGLPTQSLAPRADPFNPYGAEVTSACADPDQTTIDGECASAFVDSAALPDYTPELVFGTSDPAGGACFQPRTCFAGAREATLDPATCTAPKGGEVANVAVVTADGTGDCDATTGRCFVPLDRGDEGFVDDGERVRLSKGWCARVRAGAKLAFAGSTCATKTSATPVCTSGASPVTPADAGTDANTEAGAPDNVRLVAANGVSAVAALPDRILYASEEGVFTLAEGELQGALLSGFGPTNAPWFMAQNEGHVAFATGSDITASSARIWHVLPPGPIQPVTVSSPQNTRIVGLTVGGTYLWAPVSGNGNGGVLVSAFSPDPLFAVDGLYSMTTATATAIASGPDVWVGRPDGSVDLCTPFNGNTNILDCPDNTPLETTTAVEALASEPADRKHTYALKADGVWSVRAPAIGPSTFTVERLVTDDLSSITVGGTAVKRGVAADNRCVYYASKRGLEYVVGDKSAAGLLARAPQGTEVVGVTAPLFTAARRSVWYAAHGTAVNGGGVYRANVPAPCL